MLASLKVSFTLAVAFASLVAAGSSAAAPAAACAGGSGFQVATTASYKFVLHVGMPERMYTPAQVKKLHPKSGEVMVGGSMAMGGMTMGSQNRARHLEVQICSRKTGAVVAGAMPTISLSDSMGMITHVPVAMMRGVDAGMDDMHYGNNVTMPAGQKLTVKVTLDGETATVRLAGSSHV